MKIAIPIPIMRPITIFRPNRPKSYPNRPKHYP